MVTNRSSASVVMTLRDMLYVSYLLPAARITKILPNGLEPATTGDGDVFLSLVIFRGSTRAAFRIPAPPIPFDQINIRTYVVDPQTRKPAVYFVRCGINGRFITFMYRALSGMPVEHAPFRISGGADDDGHYKNYLAEGYWHESFSLAAEETGPSLKALEPFGSAEEALQYLMDPLTGFYSAWGGVRRLEIFHEPLKPKTCRAIHVNLPYLEGLGLLNAGEIKDPHNLLLVPHTPFEIFLPPKKQRL